MPQEEAAACCDEETGDLEQHRHHHHLHGMQRVFAEEEEQVNLNLDSLASRRVKEGLRARIYSKQALCEDDVTDSKVWHRRARMAASCSTACRVALLITLFVAIAVACFTLPIDKMLNGFLIWIHVNLGPWGPVALALAYIPLTVFAVPASILTIGGGYLFGLPIGFLADSIGAAFGATVAFLVGRTIGRPLVLAKLRDYPQFQAISSAAQHSGFKIVLLLRLVPLLPFNILNYLLSVTPISLGTYMLASWIGMMVEMLKRGGKSCGDSKRWLFLTRELKTRFSARITRILRFCPRDLVDHACSGRFDYLNDPVLSWDHGVMTKTICRQHQGSFCIGSDKTTFAHVDSFFSDSSSLAIMSKLFSSF